MAGDESSNQNVEIENRIPQVLRFLIKYRHPPAKDFPMRRKAGATRP